MNPYPCVTRRIVVFEYPTPLWLVRDIKAVKARTGDDADYIVGQPYTVRYLLEGATAWRTLTVPAGLVTDLSSVPRFVWPFINRVGPHLEASIVHDWLYVAWQDMPGWGARSGDRAFADRILLAGMKAARVSWFKRTVIYWAVRLCGGFAYRRADPVRVVEVPHAAR